MFSLGVTLYELLTLDLPFAHDQTKTGSAIGAPGEIGLKRFPVTLEAGKINLIL